MSLSIRRGFFPSHGQKISFRFLRNYRMLKQRRIKQFCKFCQFYTWMASNCRPPVPRINIEPDGNLCLIDASSRANRDKWINRKCRMCQKTEFHCRHCKHRCHKKCPGHTHHCGKISSRRSSSGSKIHTGDEHWTKVLQANETELAVCPYHGRSRVSSTKTDICRAGGGSGGDRSTLKPPSSSSHTKEQILMKDKTVFHSLYTRFCDWIESTKKESSLMTRLQSPSSSSGETRSKSDDSRPARSPDVAAFGDLATLLAADSTTRMLHSRRSTLSSSDSEPGSTTDGRTSDVSGGRWISGYSSACSSMTVTSPCTSPTTSDCCASCGTSLQMSDSSPVLDLNLEHHRMEIFHEIRSTGMLANVANAFATTSSSSSSSSINSGSRISPYLHSARGTLEDRFQGPKSSHSNSMERRSRHVRESTAQSSRSKTSEHTEELTSLSNPASEDREDLDVFEEMPEESSLAHCDKHTRDALLDWNISFNDIKIKDCLRRGLKHSIYRGRWHGDILVYVFNQISDSQVPYFLSEVNTLSKIRHENICLFMGACFRTGNMAVVTSDLKGMSIYDKLHLSSDRLPTRTRINIARQVAQAVGYLHAKGITTKTLNSKNIYFEPKVKLSLIDQAMARVEDVRIGYLCFPRGVLPYMAPETMKSLRVRNATDGFEGDAQCTNQMDSYAFGTLLYELLSGQLPWRGLLVEEILWQVCSGQQQTLVHLTCNSVLKILIERCWSYSPDERPGFSDINQELLQKTGLHKRHSSSQPERLDRQGSFNFSYNKRLESNT